MVALFLEQFQKSMIKFNQNMSFEQWNRNH